MNTHNPGIPVKWKNKIIGYTEDKKSIRITDNEAWCELMKEQQMPIGLSSHSKGIINEDGTIHQQSITPIEFFIPDSPSSKISIMKFGFDIHGLIDEIPKPLSIITKLLVENGHEVHIVTGNTIDTELKKKLNDWKIHYTHIFSIVDYHNSIGTLIEYKDNGPRMDDELWDRTKGDYCREHEIDLMIDDTLRYEQYFSTAFMCCKIKKH